MGKPAGIRTARKHVKNRRNQVWADKDYKKAHLGTRWKANPFGGASHAKVSGVLLYCHGFYDDTINRFCFREMMLTIPTAH